MQSATSNTESYEFGSLAVKVTVTGTRITSVAMTTLNPSTSLSSSIDSYAIPKLESEVIAAGSAQINSVSGATITSEAFTSAVENALQKLGLG